MKKLICCLAALLATLSVFSQKIDNYLLWDGAAAPSDNGITAEQGDTGVYLTNVTVPTLTVYAPELCNGVAVLACPGGSYLQIWEREFHNIASWYNEQGIVFAVLRYRVPNGHGNIPMEDLHRAFSILREHQKDYGFSKIGVHGNSAGGHLAANASVHYTSPENRPDFQILYYPVISMNPSFAHMASRINLIGQSPDEDEIERNSLEKQVTRETPPAFIAASSDDRLVPVRNSLEYYNALLANGVQATMHLYPSGGHGWFNKSQSDYRNESLEELKLWLRQFSDKK